MSFFDFFKLPDINQELLAFHNTKEGQRLYHSAVSTIGTNIL